MQSKKIPAIVMAAMLLMLCGMPVFAGGNAEQERLILNQRRPVVVNQDLVIRIADLKEHVIFYPVQIDGLQMEVMAVIAPDGTIRTAFNACHFCYQRNDDPRVLDYYVQITGPQLASLCGSSRILNMNDIQIVSNACHPTPILPENRTETASTLTITREYFTQAKAMFEEMKLLGERGSCCD
jgi:hypothetical protein